MKQLFITKRLSKEQVKQILEFASRTVFKHVALIELTFSKKRGFVEREVKVMLAEPRVMGNLETQCKEVLDDNLDAFKSQQDFYQAEETGALDEAQQQTKESAEEVHPEADVDPEDPLYGLEQRLKNMNLDEESRRIIREKLDEANHKVKFALDERQKNLDVKLAGGAGAAAGPPKKK